jgi:hypothetical protein
MNSPKSRALFVSQIPAGQSEYVERSLNYRVAPDGSVYVGDAPDIGLLKELDEFVRLSLENELEPFCIEPLVRDRSMLEIDTNGRRRFVERPFHFEKVSPNVGGRASQELADLLRIISPHARILNPSDPEASQLLYAPHFRLLREVLLAHPISARLTGNGRSAVDATGLTIEQLYNDFVARFRQAFLAQRSSLWDELHNWRLSSKENVVNLHAYLDGLFARHGSVTVLHFRLLHTREPVNR